ncbi:MAG: PadR family transcriptional regulator [Chloroflexota bacterium]
MAEPHALNTTAYALLGLLAVKPWTTYELAQQMRRGFGDVWPRAESNLYEGPKALVQAGLATAAVTATGQRRRTTYSITPEGRAALAEWLGRPSGPPRLEFEAMVRVIFSEHGTTEQLLATLRQTREQASASRATIATLRQEYEQGQGRFPERTRMNLWMLRFLEAHFGLIERWADQTLAEAGAASC